MNIAKRGKKLNKQTIAAMNDGIRFLRTHKDVKVKVKERDPALIQDEKRIIHFIPIHFKHKEMEASLFLIGVQAGVRSITVSNMILSDIVRVTISEETKKILCALRFNRTKCSSSWWHEVTIEGDEEKEDDGDAVFWFSKYLKKSTGVKLSDWMDKSEAVEKLNPVWPLSTDAMRERFKERAKKRRLSALSFQLPHLTEWIYLLCSY